MPPYPASHNLPDARSSATVRSRRWAALTARKNGRRGCDRFETPRRESATSEESRRNVQTDSTDK
jgi:hypothetical protein